MTTCCRLLFGAFNEDSYIAEMTDDDNRDVWGGV